MWFLLRFIMGEKNLSFLPHSIGASCFCPSEVLQKWSVLVPELGDQILDPWCQPLEGSKIITGYPFTCWCRSSYIDKPFTSGTFQETTWLGSSRLDLHHPSFKAILPNSQDFPHFLWPKRPPSWNHSCCVLRRWDAESWWQNRGNCEASLYLWRCKRELNGTLTYLPTCFICVLCGPWAR